MKKQNVNSTTAAILRQKAEELFYPKDSFVTYKIFQLHKWLKTKYML